MIGSWLRAAVLLAAYSLGSPALASWIARRASLGREASSLVFDLSCFSVAAALVVVARAAGARVEPAKAGLAWRSGALALGALGLLALVLRILDPLYDRSEFSLRSLVGPADLAAFLIGLPFGVAAEELVFRTCQRELRRVLLPGTTAFSVGLAFSLYHFAPGTPFDRHLVETLVAVFVGGIVLAAVFETTGSLPLLIIVHLAYDLLAVTQATLNVEGARLAEAALFFAWIGGAAAIARAAHRTPPALSSPLRHEAGRASIPPGRLAAEWAAAVAFGGGLPVTLVWLRTLYGF